MSYTMCALKRAYQLPSIAARINNNRKVKLLNFKCHKYMRSHETPDQHANSHYTVTIPVQYFRLIQIVNVLCYMSSRSLVMLLKSNGVTVMKFKTTRIRRHLYSDQGGRLSIYSPRFLGVVMWRGPFSAGITISGSRGLGWHVLSASMVFWCFNTWARVA